MYVTGISVFIISVLIALIANYKLRHLQRLPMQWGLSGQVNRTAPRAYGLALFPALYAFIAAFIIFAGISGHEAITTRSLLILAIAILGTQLFHLVLIDKTHNS
ncbi:DUF1648 domain-containing protein [Bacillus subtilis]|uniref:DUF1648 domain-containing protein n=1 Tax=Pseudochrobactrum asaccharolyticum TaxID=354351 RepID=UPI001F238EF0|nr:DUF1648 domain-containing protein [Pseudochrobactrum asaccharolyticum]MCF7645966.1 DUF1648 domain-containing protein [Pseudochrobactrum asaccharolyticum]MCF7672432.1 DUF1648 domain-containing protein [Bacillus subtilis]